MKPFCFAKDQIIAIDKASIHPMDIGLIRGYAIFDFIRVDNFQPYFLEDYLQRFINSAKSCALPLDFSKDELREIIYELIEKNGMQQGGIRMLLSGGISENKFSPSKGQTFIFCENLKMPPREKYEKGVL